MAMGKDKAIISVKQREIMNINNKLELIRKNLVVYERSGLRKSKEARKLVGDLNELIFERDELIKEDIRDRRDCIAYLLLCIAAADFSREACDMLEDKLKKTYGKVQEGQLDFLTLLREFSEHFGSLVSMIDSVKDERFSLNFAALRDEMMDTMTEINLAEARAIVHRHHDADNGHNIEFKANEHYYKIQRDAQQQREKGGKHE